MNSAMLVARLCGELCGLLAEAELILLHQTVVGSRCSDTFTHLDNSEKN